MLTILCLGLVVVLRVGVLVFGLVLETWCLVNITAVNQLIFLPRDCIISHVYGIISAFSLYSRGSRLQTNERTAKLSVDCDKVKNYNAKADTR